MIFSSVRRPNKDEAVLLRFTIWFNRHTYYEYYVTMIIKNGFYSPALSLIRINQLWVHIQWVVLKRFFDTALFITAKQIVTSQTFIVVICWCIVIGKEISNRISIYRNSVKGIVVALISIRIVNCWLSGYKKV